MVVYHIWFPENVGQGTNVLVFLLPILESVNGRHVCGWGSQDQNVGFGYVGGGNVFGVQYAGKGTQAVEPKFSTNRKAS